MCSKQLDPCLLQERFFVYIPTLSFDGDERDLKQQTDRPKKKENEKKNRKIGKIKKRRKRNKEIHSKRKENVEGKELEKEE